MVSRIAQKQKTFLLALLGLLVSFSVLYLLFRRGSQNHSAAGSLQHQNFFSRASIVWSRELVEYESCKETNFSDVFRKRKQQLHVWPNPPSNRKNRMFGPGNGLGNQLYGFAQGVSLAKFSKRQLLIEWKFHELFRYTVRWLPHKKFLSSKKFPSLHYMLRSSRASSIAYEGSYRDKICSLLSPTALDNLSRSELDLRTALLRVFLVNSSQAEEWYANRVICVRVVSCIFKNALEPTRVLRETLESVTSAVLVNEELISMHVRLGDKEMLKAVAQKQKDIHFEKGRFLPMSFGIKMLEYALEYKSILKARGKKIRFFIATDTPSFLEVARKYLGSELLVVDGVGSIGLTEYGDSDVMHRAALDFSLLSLADHVICGPWSTFVNTALLWGYSPTKNIFQCKYESYWSVSKGASSSAFKSEAFSCRRTALRDYWKGAKPEPL